GSRSRATEYVSQLRSPGLCGELDVRLPARRAIRVSEPLPGGGADCAMAAYAGPLSCRKPPGIGIAKTRRSDQLPPHALTFPIERCRFCVSSDVLSLGCHRDWRRNRRL